VPCSALNHLLEVDVQLTGTCSGGPARSGSCLVAKLPSLPDRLLLWWCRGHTGLAVHTMSLPARSCWHDRHSVGQSPRTRLSRTTYPLNTQQHKHQKFIVTDNYNTDCTIKTSRPYRSKSLYYEIFVQRNKVLSAVSVKPGADWMLTHCKWKRLPEQHSTLAQLIVAPLRTVFQWYNADWPVWRHSSEHHQSSVASRMTATSTQSKMWNHVPNGQSAGAQRTMATSDLSMNEHIHTCIKE